MLIMFLILLIVVLLVVLAVRSPSTRLQAVDGWQQLHKAASVRLAALTGLLQFAPEIAQQVRDLLPQLQAIQGVGVLDRLFASDAYHTALGLMTLFIILARGIKLPPKPDADKP